MCCADSVVPDDGQSWLKLLEKDIFGTRTGIHSGASHLMLAFLSWIGYW